MARHYKKWEDHSPRWQREHSRKGETKQRWNAWLRLSEKTRKDTTPTEYAAGKSVAMQRRGRKEAEAVRRIKSVNRSGSRTSVIVQNVHRMSDKDLDWTLKASPQQIKARAAVGKSVVGYSNINPWWYR